MFNNKILKTETINYDDFGDFEPKSPKYNINHCKKYFEDVKDILLENKEMFDKTYLFIIRPTTECKATDLYIKNKIKLLKKFNVKVSIIYNDYKENDIDKLINTIKYYMKKNKGYSFYYLLQKDYTINNFDFRYIYEGLNNAIKYNKLNLTDVEFLNPSYSNTPIFNLQLDAYQVSNIIGSYRNFIGKCLVGACTPVGAINMLMYYNKIKHGDNCIVYGKSDILGRPLYDILSQMGCTVLVFNSKSNQNIYDKILPDIDHIFLCMSSSNFFNSELYDKVNKDKCNIIDFGITYDDGYLAGNISKEVLESYSKTDMNNIITVTPSGTALSTLIQILINIYLNECFIKNF